MAWHLKALATCALVTTSSTIYALVPTNLTEESISSHSVNDLEKTSTPKNLISGGFMQEPSSPILPHTGLNVASSSVASKHHTQNLSEAQKYKERFENPELCREVLSSKEDKSKVLACRTSKDSSEIEFEFHTGIIGEMPILINELRYTYRELVVKLAKADSYGSTSRILDLSPEIIVGRGIIPLTGVGYKAFTSKQCKIEQNDGLDVQRNEWKINCQVSPK